MKSLRCDILSTRIRFAILPGILLFLSALSALAADPKPLLVVVEFDPLNQWLGSDSPKLVLYEDGTLICKAKMPESNEPFHVTRVSDLASFTHKLIPPNFRELPSAFDLCLTFGREKSTLIWTPEKQIEIQGEVVSLRPTNRFHRDIENGVRSQEIDSERTRRQESFPTEIRQLLARVEELRVEAGAAWLPTEIEILFVPYDFPRSRSVAWPAEWPDEHATTNRKLDRDTFVVRVPSELYPKLRVLLSSARMTGSAIIIDGHPMNFGIHFPFPHEAEWIPEMPPRWFTQRFFR